MDMLVAGENVIDAYLTKAALEDGFERARINLVHGGVEALGFLRQQGVYQSAPRPDLIVLDLHFSKLTGLSLLCALKTSPALRHIPVVVLTNPNLDAEQQTIYELGAHYYLCKPKTTEAYRMVGHVIAELWQCGLLRPGNRPSWDLPDAGI